MIIDQLPSVGTPALTDETVTEQGQNLFKVTWQRLLTLFKGNTALSELSNDAGFVNSAGAAAAAPVQSVDGRAGAVTTLSNATPSPLGTATPGTADYSARADHVHAMPSADDVGAMSQWELLWENANQGSSFSAQTVSLDLTNYDAVIVVYRNEPGSGNGWNTSFIVFRDRPLLGLAMSGNAKFSYRVTTMYDSGVRFENGMFASSYGGAATDNSKSIPAKIYGIKGVETT